MDTEISLTEQNKTEFQVGDYIEKYEILREISRGGMGIIYLAFDHALNRTVAIKIILIEAESEESTLLQRFVREAKISAQLQHKNIVKIYNAGVFLNKPYLVMEYIEGIPLIAYVNKYCKQDFYKIVEVIVKLAEALSYIHKKDIVHRDLKPLNVLVRPNGEPVLIDFGIAKMSRNGGIDLTRTGEVMGALLYMSPEQADGNTAQADARSDIYSLGMILYHLITKHQPYAKLNVYDTLNHIQNHDIPLPREINPEIPEFLEEIILKATEKKPNRRYLSASQMARQLYRFLDGTGVPSKEYYHKIWMRTHKTWIYIFITLCIILLCIICIIIYLQFRNNFQQFRNSTTVSPKNETSQQQTITNEISQQQTILKKDQSTYITTSEKDNQPEKEKNIAKDEWQSQILCSFDKEPYKNLLHQEGFIYQEKAYGTCEIDIYLHEQTGMKFALIPPGNFVMGLNKKNIETLSRSSRTSQQIIKTINQIVLPSRRVTIAKPFLMSQYECTQKNWKQVMTTEPWLNRLSSHDLAPATFISWEDCQNFCQRLNEKSNVQWSLPTEAQWEYACRAGSDTLYFWGDNVDIHIHGKYSLCLENSKLSNNSNIFSIQLIGRTKPNPFFLYDMTGNVSEWCKDDWMPHYQNAPLDDTARCFNSSIKVIRGSHVIHPLRNSMSIIRSGVKQSETESIFGARFVVNF